MEHLPLYYYETRWREHRSSATPMYRNIRIGEMVRRRRFVTTTCYPLTGWCGQRN
jgi:hypothetical protein